MKINERLNVITERTLLPVSLIMGLLSISVWVGTIQTKVDNNTSRLSRSETISVDSKTRLDAKLDDISTRLAKIEGKLDYKINN